MNAQPSRAKTVKTVKMKCHCTKLPRTRHLLRFNKPSRYWIMFLSFLKMLFKASHVDCTFQTHCERSKALERITSAWGSLLSQWFSYFSKTVAPSQRSSYLQPTQSVHVCLTLRARMFLECGKRPENLDGRRVKREQDPGLAICLCQMTHFKPKQTINKSKVESSYVTKVCCSYYSSYWLWMLKAEVH